MSASAAGKMLHIFFRDERVMSISAGPAMNALCIKKQISNRVRAPLDGLTLRSERAFLEDGDVPHNIAEIEDQSRLDVYEYA
jgi:hypothetical protein